MNKEWLKKKGLEKWFQRDNLMILILCGILLFIIALPTKKEEKSDSVQFSAVVKGEQEQGNTGAKKDSAEDEREYVVYLEERLEKMLSAVDGVGKVSVMVTLESTEELVLEKDEPVKQSSVEEKDSQGGSRVSTQLERQESTIYTTEGSDSEPYVIKRLLPKIEGIVVVAQGADSGKVNKNITEILQALFGVEAHKIKVVPMG